MRKAENAKAGWWMRGGWSVRTRGGGQLATRECDRGRGTERVCSEAGFCMNGNGVRKKSKTKLEKKEEKMDLYAEWAGIQIVIYEST